MDFLARDIRSKKGYFFLIDVFMAMFIITIGILMLLSSFLAQSERSQATFTSRSLALFMANMSIVRYESPLKYDVLLSYDGGSYTNHNFLKVYTNTLLEQIGEFYYRETQLPSGHPDEIPATPGTCSSLDLACRLAQDISENIVPAQFEVALYIRNPLEEGEESLHIVYKRHINPIFDRENSPLLIPSKTMVTGVFEDSIDGSPVIWGPYIVEVHVWQ